MDDASSSISARFMRCVTMLILSEQDGATGDLCSDRKTPNQVTHGTQSEPPWAGDVGGDLVSQSARCSPALGSPPTTGESPTRRPAPVGSAKCRSTPSSLRGRLCLSEWLPEPEPASPQLAIRPPNADGSKSPLAEADPLLEVAAPAGSTSVTWWHRVSKAIRASNRAKGAPRQRWMPLPNPM